MELPDLQPPANPATPPEAHPATSPPPVYFPLSAFVGPNGVRAGWRLLAFIVVALVLGEIFLKLSALFLGLTRIGFPPFRWLSQEAALACAVLLAAWLLAKLERRSFAEYALPGRSAFGPLFWRGVVWGVVALTALLGILHVGHAFDFGSLALRGASLAAYAAGWALVFLVVGIFEEFISRGYALFTLTTGMGFWPSAILLSVAFGALHLRNPGEDWMGGVAAALIGLFWCLTVRRTGSLWFAIGLHASWDYAESFIYGVPDSGAVLPGHLLNSSFHGPAWLTGGSVGPEGSAVVFAVIGVMFVIFHGLYREARFPLKSCQRSAISGQQDGSQLTVEC